MSEHDEKRQLLTDLLNIADRDTLLGGVREDWASLAKGLHRIGYRRVGELAEHDRQVAERAWDEGYEAAAEFHEGREKGHWENDFPTKGMRTWRPDPAPTSPYRAAKGGQQ